jgi:predicted metal-dependent phosphotriesterase family hydrolase
LAPDFLTRFEAYGASTGATVPTGPTDLSYMQSLDLMVDELSAAKREGVGCIVDGGHPDMGRNTGVLRQLSMRSGMPIVVSAGFYSQPFYARDITGYADNHMFSSDQARPNRIKKNGGPGYAKTLTVFLPKLKAAGASNAVLRQLTHDNPRRFLAFVPKKPRPLAT